MEYLKCAKIDTAITRAKTMLMNKASKNGVYENFGQKEVIQIKDKFIDYCDYSVEMNSNRSKLEQFENWCCNYCG